MSDIDFEVTQVAVLEQSAVNYQEALIEVKDGNFVEFNLASVGLENAQASLVKLAADARMINMIRVVAYSGCEFKNFDSYKENISNEIIQIVNYTQTEADNIASYVVDALKIIEQQSIGYRINDYGFHVNYNYGWPWHRHVGDPNVLDVLMVLVGKGTMFCNLSVEEEKYENDHNIDVNFKCNDNKELVQQISDGNGVMFTNSINSPLHKKPFWSKDRIMFHVRLIKNNL